MSLYNKIIITFICIENLFKIFSYKNYLSYKISIKNWTHLDYRPILGTVVQSRLRAMEVFVKG